MTTDVIIALIIFWAIVGVLLGGMTTELKNYKPEYGVIVFFWPVTLPVFLVFGLVYALYHSFKICISWTWND